MIEYQNNLDKKMQFLSIGSWIIMLIVAETNFVFAAMTESYILIGPLALISAIMAAIYVFKKGISFKNIEPFIVLYALFWVFATIRFIHPLQHTDLFFYWIGVFMIFASQYYKDVFSTDAIWKTIKILGIIFALGVILQFLFTDIFMEYYYPLFADTFKESIYRQVIEHKMYPGWPHQTWATCLNLMIAIGTFVVFSDKEKFNSLTRIIFILVIMVAFLFTGRRGPLVFLVGTLIITEFLTADNFKSAIKNLIKYAMIILVAFAIVKIMLLFFDTSDENRNTFVRLEETFKGSAEEASNGRFELWRLAGELYREHPFWGIGWRQYNLSAMSILHEDSHVHNVFLQLLTEIGVVGLILYVIPVVYAFLDTFKLFRLSKKNNNDKLTQIFKYTLFMQTFLLLCSCTESLIFYYSYYLAYCFIFCIYIAAKQNWKKYADENNIIWNEKLLRK